jgi:hypothetical protein
MDGVGGLEHAWSVAISPGGKLVYVASLEDRIEEGTMRFSKHIRSTRFRLFARFLITFTFFLSLLSNNLVLALPQTRPSPEPVPSLDPLPSISLSVMDEPEFSPAPSVSPAPPIPDARSLPADLADLPELVDQRTASSATFQVGQNRYATIVDAGALHYQDSQGAWQIIDPTFRPAENSFVVEHNSIRSRAGLSAARLSAAVGDTIMVWQATALGAATGTDGSQFIPLAKALAEPPSFAQKREGGRVLHYAGNWSDPSLAEEIVSAPGSLEHLLILSEAPGVDVKSGFENLDFLEMRATLKLLPGAELWADGQPQSEAFETAGGLEIRTAGGTAALVFDPVLAFECERPSIAVGGTYTARPGDEPGTWTIGLRTPWRWWTDPARRYPAVIDPTMHVLRSTGYGDGIAWVANGHSGNPDSSDQSLHFGEMVLGSWAGSGRYSGYVQFNSIPHMLTNAPISVTAAYVDIEPSHVRMPYYSNWEGPDWEMYSTQHDATLYDLGQCPGDCGGFSLVSEPVGFDWNNVPQGTASFVIPLVGPPWKGGGQTTVTSWDVTNRVRTWNQQHPRPADGPAFRLTVNTNCPVSSFDGDSAQHIPKCTRLVIPAGNARLRIEYDELPIAVGDSFLNDPGVPSFYEGVFEEGTTNHQYDLAIPAGLEHWRAAAVRGNHALAPALPTRTGLKLVDHSNDPVDLVNGTVQGADKTAVVLIDEHNPNNLIEAADLWAEVTASNDNDFPTDEDRNYRIEHQRASEWPLPYSAWQTQNIMFSTARLIHLGEFDLETGDNVLIRVSAPVTFPLTIGLAAPTTGSDKADSALGNVNLDKKFEPEGQPIRDKSFTVSRSGVWALAFINEGRPIADPRPPPGSAIAQPVVVEILRCPLGSIATARWLCQPVILPDIDTPSATGLGLTVYSEGGFDGDPTGDTWCTANEGNGTPIIGPDVNGRWVVVGQGSVCRSGDTISTTDDSGIGLAIEVPNPNPFPDGTTRGKLPPTFVYGSVAHYPLPTGYPTGVVVRAGDSGQLEPEVDTRRNLAPFDELWGSVFTPGDDAIATTDMKAHGEGIIDAAVTVDAAAAPENLDWDVLWSLYPEEVAEYDFIFEAQAQQSPALPSPTLLASLQLRILDAGNVATGLIEGLDAFKFESNVVAGQLRAAKAKITQDDDLGGATKNIQVVVQPPGFARLPANEKSCSHLGAATSCLDLRRDDYEWNNGGGDKNVQPWELPDIHIEDSAGSMIFSRPGDLQIFSADHPYATNFDQSFSFDTWGATVSVKEEACTQGGPVVTVVRGSANIALPSVGDDGSGGSGGILVDFKLCQAKLYQAKITLSVPPPGIPAGSTGVGINLIGGEVTVDPDFTQIELQLGFQSMDGGTITGGNGSVLIDTRGLFELQASATIVGLLDAELLLQVAWNPLDVLLEAGVSCCGGLISGGLRLHAWLGQGWQHKYPWLDDNDDFHFAGSIQATLKIPEGYIADLGIMELPPFDLTRSLKIAFGEFCIDSNCSDYAWGMSVVFTIVGVDVGLYVDTDGPEFILGTDSHVLIDQFGGSSQRNVTQANAPTGPPPPPYEISQPGNWQIFVVKPFKTPVDKWPIQPAGSYGCTGIGTSVHTCPIAVGAGAGRALFTVGWENGSLDVALIKPDLTVITPANAAAHSVAVSETSTLLADQVSFGVPEAAIMSGVWQVQMSNVISDTQAPFQTNYQILYAAEPPPPTLTWNSPLNPGTTPGAGGIATLDWTALRAGQPLTPGTKIELFYTPIDQKPITPTLMTGTPITNHIAANQGTYPWDTNGLASGEYAVGGQIDDHAHANGHIVAWAPGTIVISDTTPPPAPIVLGTTDLKDALIVIWQRDNTTPDLAGYLVEYTIPAWDENAPQLGRVRRMLPHSPDQWPWFERIRLGGLLGGQPTTYCVRAYDASGNVSACTPDTHDVPLRPPSRLGPPQRIIARGEQNPFTAKTQFRIDWLPPDASTGTPAGYALSYNLAGCVLPGASSLANEGSSPLDVGNVLAYNLTGLTIGQTYRLAVNGYTANGYVGPEAAIYALFIDPTDGNFDGLPDQWADLYNLSGGADDDPDGDGLTNGEELALRSNPLNADSDGDGYYDNEEVDWQTDVCGPEHPPYHTAPKLTLVGSSELEFTVTGNQLIIAPQSLYIFNFGGGTLEWSATASEPWIALGSEGGSGQSTLSIGVDPNGLTRGHYTGTITLVNLSAQAAAERNRAAAEREIATIDVSLEVLAPKDFSHYVFLPLVFR